MGCIFPHYLPCTGIFLLLINTFYGLPVFVVIMINAGISWTKYFYVNKQDKAARGLLNQAFGYNMRPEALPRHIQVKLHNELCTHFKQAYGPSAKWEEMIRKGQLDEANRPVLYALARYARLFNTEVRYDDLFHTVARYHAAAIPVH